MKKVILELGPIVLGYGCVILSIVGIIKDISIGDTSDMTLPMHILLAILWCVVAIKWTVQYLHKKKEEKDEP